MVVLKRDDYYIIAIITMMIKIRLIKNKLCWSKKAMMEKMRGNILTLMMEAIRHEKKDDARER